MGLFDQIHDLVGGGFDETAPLTLADQEAVGEVPLPEQPAEAVQQVEEQISALQDRINLGE